MKLDPNERSDNVEDYRGRTGGGGGGRGGGFRFGIGTLVILAIGYFLGFDPRLIMGLLQGVQSMTPDVSGPMEAAPAGSGAPRADDPQAVFVSEPEAGVVFGSGEFWLRSRERIIRTVLLPRRSETLYRSQFLPAAGYGIRRTR
jgi:hypothetical protein